MIDVLRKIALRIRPLRGVAVVLGTVCLAAAATIVLGLPADSGANRYLVPAIVGFIWCLSAYGFVDTFRSVPERSGRTGGFFVQLKHRALRAWFWVLAALFAVSTFAALLLTLKLGAVWLDH